MLFDPALGLEVRDTRIALGASDGTEHHVWDLRSSRCVGEIDALLDLAVDIGGLRVAVRGRHEEECVHLSQRIAQRRWVFRIDLHEFHPAACQVAGTFGPSAADQCAHPCALLEQSVDNCATLGARRPSDRDRPRR